MFILALLSSAVFCQGGLNKKDIQLNLCSIFSIFIFNEIFIHLMSFNRLKLGRAVTFIKYIASVVSLIFLALTLIWNKITFPASDTLNLAQLVVDKPVNSIYKKSYQYSFFCSICYCLM